MTQKFSVRQTVGFVFAVTFTALTTPVFAQGVAGVVVTSHIVDPGPQIFIGNSAMPIPIDLDPNGGSWFKNVGDPQINVPGPAIVDMFETIQNVGTEAWGDWHEFLFPAPAGLAPHTWTNVVSLAVNGSPIGFTATGLGTQTLDLFNFSQPVMPGDIFSIHKQLNVNGTALVSGAFLRIAEYPTPAVPEPASLSLFMFGSVLLCGARRRRC
ncbi:MAG: PEP-CTERM sorting domain-containing protein [Bythopirellula sp.]|nr:PEP-CTERM sorting domain-containing protein [Bythopirellula sp.]